MTGASYPKPDLGPLPELAWLPVDRLDVDPSYQRSLDTRASQKLIDKIAAEFRWPSFQAILATPQGDGDAGRWLIIDGQHRAAAARRCGIKHLPAVVIAGLSLADQAHAFLGANRDRVPVSAQALFHAKVRAGDQDAATIKRHCDAAGIVIEKHNISANQLRPGRTAAVPAMLRALVKFGEASTGGAIAAVAERFRNEAGALRAANFLSAAQFLADGGTAEGLRRALASIAARDLEAAGIGLNGPHAVAEKLALLRRKSEQGAAPKAPSAAPAQPFKAGPLPQTSSRPASVSVATKPASPPAPKPAAADQAAIDKFLAEKGARLVMGPEQVAAFRREAGHSATIRLAESAPRGSRYLDQAQPELDGKPVTLAQLYEAANALRAKAGLPPVSGAVPAKRAAA